MRLNELDKSQIAIRALKANFDVDFNTSKLNRSQTKTMLDKVNGLIKEAKSQPDFYKNQNDPSYMKLIFMSQALNEHYSNTKTAKIIVENQEVEKSQVILAAQDMVNSLQKMIEEVNDMLVKELPALTDSIQSEMGVNESAAFNQAASESLTTLNQTLSQSKQSLQGALNGITGQGGDPAALGAAPTGGEEMAVTDVAATAGPGGEEVVGAEMGAEVAPDAAEMPAEEPEAEPTGGVGREKR
jgi:hypothetical protein